MHFSISMTCMIKDKVRTIIWLIRSKFNLTNDFHQLLEAWNTRKKVPEEIKGSWWSLWNGYGWVDALTERGERERDLVWEYNVWCEDENLWSHWPPSLCLKRTIGLCLSCLFQIRRVRIYLSILSLMIFFSYKNLSLSHIKRKREKDLWITSLQNFVNSTLYYKPLHINHVKLHNSPRFSSTVRDVDLYAYECSINRPLIIVNIDQLN